MIYVVLDYPKITYLNNKKEVDFGASKLGHNLNRRFRKLNLVEGRDFQYKYLYNKIPEPDKLYRGRVVSYKDPNAEALKPFIEKLNTEIATNKPSIIIPMGKLGSKWATGTNLKSSQGVPIQHDFAGFTTWVLPMYNEELIEIQPNNLVHQRLSLSVLKDYLDKGEEVFKPVYASYHTLTTVADVKKYLSKVYETHEMAWDLETNTLSANYPGAKVLIFSFAWKDGGAACIPIEHMEVYSPTGTTVMQDKSIWKPEDLSEIWGMIRKILYDKTIQKVGHNIQFDENFLLATKHATHFVNVADTLIGYFLEIDQQAKDSRRLSDLAYSFVNMGGYDQPLEDYKDWLLGEAFAKAFSLLTDRIKKSGDDNYQLNRDDRKELIDSIDWSFMKDNKVYNDRMIHWVLDIIVIPRVNKFRKINSLRSDVDDNSSKANISYEWIPMELMGYYAAGDSDCCLRIFHRLLRMMESDERDPKNKIETIYLKYYPKLTYALASIQNNGMHVDTDYLDSLHKAYGEYIKSIIDKIRKFPTIQDLEAERRNLYQIGLEECTTHPKVKDRDPKKAQYRDKYKGAKAKFNIHSGPDKSELLFKRLGLRLPVSQDYLKNSAPKDEARLTWKDYKTDKLTLNYLLEHTDENSEAHQIVQSMLDYAAVSVLYSSFVVGIQKKLFPDGRIHGRFNSHGTATGRLSSSQPNLQNQAKSSNNPKDFKHNYPIKRMYTSRFEHGYISNIDYSNLEMRIMGLVSHDDDMTETFLSGKDVHKQTAALAFKIPYDEVSKDQRQAAKKVNFGNLYGIGVSSLAKQIGASEQYAQKVQDSILNSKPELREFIEKTHEFVEKNGFVNTMNGFRRDLMDIYSTDKSNQSGALRESVNTEIQGSGAILTNTSLYYITEYLRKNKLKSKIIATVHDSIVLDVAPDEVYTVPPQALYIMEHLPYPWLFAKFKGRVIRYPITAEMSIGPTYNDQVEFNPDEAKQFTSLDAYIKYYQQLSELDNYLDNKLVTEEEYVKKKKEIEDSKKNLLT